MMWNLAEVAVRKPPHTGLRPAALTFPLMMRLKVRINLRDGAIDQLWCETDAHLASDHAVFKAWYQDQTVLLRRAPISAYDREVKIHDRLKALKEHGAPVLPLLEAPVQLGAHCYSVQPYLEHRLYHNTQSDLAALAVSIENLNRAFTHLPKQADTGKHIVDVWMEGATELSGQDAAYEICRETFEGMRKQGGLAHNDIHTGNVLFDQKGEAIIIDFEESIDHQSHSLLDFHATVERFILIDQPSRGDLEKKIQAFGSLSTYYDFALFKAIGAIKNNYFTAIARARGLDTEYEKFRMIAGFWKSL